MQRNTADVCMYAQQQQQQKIVTKATMHTVSGAHMLTAYIHTYMCCKWRHVFVTHCVAFVCLCICIFACYAVCLLVAGK